MAKTLLVIDDSRTIQKAFEFTFKRTEFKHVAAFSAEEGINKANEISPDVIIVDSALPDMDGMELLKKIKSQPNLATIPTIVLTGMSSNLTEEEVKAAGAFALAKKPFGTDAMIELVQKASEATPEAAGVAEAAEEIEDLVIEEIPVKQAEPEQPAPSTQEEPVMEAILEPVEEEEEELLEELPIETEQEDGADSMEMVMEELPEEEVEEISMEPIEEGMPDSPSVDSVEEEAPTDVLDIPEAGAELEPIEDGMEAEDSISDEMVIEELGPEDSVEEVSLYDELPSEEGGDLEYVQEVEESSVEDELVVDMTMPEESDSTPETESVLSIEDEVREDVQGLDEAEDLLEVSSEEDEKEAVDEDLLHVETPVEDDEDIEVLELEGTTIDGDLPAESIDIAPPEQNVLGSESVSQQVRGFVSDLQVEPVIAVPADEAHLLEQAKNDASLKAVGGGTVALNEEQVNAIIMEALKKLTADKLEAIAWEVVPELAEVIIKKELDRITAERG